MDAAQKRRLSRKLTVSIKLDSLEERSLLSGIGGGLVNGSKDHPLPPRLVQKLETEHQAVGSPRSARLTAAANRAMSPHARIQAPHRAYPHRFPLHANAARRAAAISPAEQARATSTAANTSLTTSPLVVSSYTAVAKGARQLGIAVTTAQDGSYTTAFNYSMAAGMNSTTLALNWTDIETSPGVYGNGFLDIANSYYPSQGTKVDLILRPINTNQVSLPSDLAGRTFDDPVVVARFEKMLSYVFTRIPNLTLNSLAIGNEVDHYLGTNASRWAQYQNFYKEVSDYARTLRPGLKVGVVATVDGLKGATASQLASLNTSSDVIMATYYPIKANFTVKDPSVVSTDWNALTSKYAGRQIVFTEVGFPSSTILGSSQSKQAKFVQNIFRAWDIHASQISSVTFSWLTDISSATAKQYQTYYGTTSTYASQFFQTLGLRTNVGSGVDKQAYTMLVSEARLRGW